MTDRHLRRRRSAAKSRAPRCRAAGARERPCVVPPVADRSSGRFGTIRLERRARRAERYSRSFERLVRVPYATACGSLLKPLLKHGNTRARGELLGVTVLSTGRPGLRSRSEERTNERASGRPFELALDVRADEQFFFHFKYAQRYIRTQHCHGSVSRDRMAHMWRAHSVGRAILPRS